MHMLGAYGNQLAATPALDAPARSGARFDRRLLPAPGADRPTGARARPVPGVAWRLVSVSRLVLQQVSQLRAVVQHA
ncbi:hypothetical protein GCM10022379_39390 [Micromonospora maritima]